MRAHGILHDSLGVYREVDGRPVHDFARVDAVLDRLLETGLRPIVELSFMPRDLARDPDRTVFAYGGIISPPRDWDRWTGLVRELVAHLAERYGRDEVAEWAFEVWNEPNLGLFWDDAESAYLRLYDASRGGRQGRGQPLPGRWPGDRGGGLGGRSPRPLRRDRHADRLRHHPHLRHAPARPAAGHRPRSAGRTSRCGGPSGASAPGTARRSTTARGEPRSSPVGMRSGAGRLDAISYWVASDHFVELGEAEALFHGGFGLLTIGNLRKPRFWAIAMLEGLGTHEVACALEGDGAGSLVEAWASIDDDGRVSVACWNGTLAQANADGDPRLERRVAFAIEGLAGGRYELRHWRVDATHSNIRRRWEELGAPEWPDADGWAALRAADRLELLEPVREVTATDGRIELEIVLPMPAISRIDLVPRA